MLMHEFDSTTHYHISIYQYFVRCYKDATFAAVAVAAGGGGAFVEYHKINK